MLADLPPVVDCHVHPFLGADTNTSWFPGTDTPEAFAAELRRAGIAQWCGAPVRPLAAPTFADVDGLNRDMLALARIFGASYIPAATVHPAFPDESCAALENLHAAGVRWIGELVAYMSGYKSYDTPGMRRILDLAQDLGMVVNIHPFDLDEIGRLCAAFPRLAVVVAHPTESRNGILARFDLLARRPNACLDLSGSGLFRWGMLRAGIDRVGPDRFLFGTDFPICNPALLLQGVLFEHLDDRETEAVLGGNFRRLTATA
ncbi:MAG: amidohydrolase family protein [Lentisphaeria bacterium]|jgi:predicted TIM-barrel fold metal-dependent hydrolase|nr:amidohydrolase family protein [Lentisphaeria bacterium]